MDEKERDLRKELSGLTEDWDVISRLLPAGWEAQARPTRAYIFSQGIGSAAILLRILLIHLSDGCSLRETAVRAREGGLAAVSDVALLKRLRHCGAWFGWMVRELAGSMALAVTPTVPGRRLRLVDGSVVCEPGATGSTWRLHYAIDLASLCCDEAIVTSAEQGEHLTRFTVEPGDVLLADRGFAKRPGIRHVVAHGGDVIVRINLDNAPMETSDGQRFELLPQLRTLRQGQVGEWSAGLHDEHGVIPVRVCAVRKSRQQTQRAQEKLLREAKKKHRTVKPQTLEAAGYIVVQTTLQVVDAATIMEWYRYRWQIELAFKRLKSLLQLGHLKKTDPVGAQAWLQGKLLVALLIEKLIFIGERFSPWGYPLQDGAALGGPMPVARNLADAFPVEPGRQSRAVAAQQSA